IRRCDEVCPEPDGDGKIMKHSPLTFNYCQFNIRSQLSISSTASLAAEFSAKQARSKGDSHEAMFGDESPPMPLRSVGRFRQCKPRFGPGRARQVHYGSIGPADAPDLYGEQGRIPAA